jgi:hypothetical protein
VLVPLIIPSAATACQNEEILLGSRIEEVFGDDSLVLKGIVSRDFCVLFLIYLDRYEVPYRSGSGLFFILKRSSYLNFKKSLYCQYIRFVSADPGIVTVRRIFGEF